MDRYYRRLTLIGLEAKAPFEPISVETGALVDAHLVRDIDLMAREVLLSSSNGIDAPLRPHAEENALHLFVRVSRIARFLARVTCRDDVLVCEEILRITYEGELPDQNLSRSEPVDVFRVLDAIPMNVEIVGAPGDAASALFMRLDVLVRRRNATLDDPFVLDEAEIAVSPIVCGNGRPDEELVALLQATATAFQRGDGHARFMIGAARDETERCEIWDWTWEGLDEEVQSLLYRILDLYRPMRHDWEPHDVKSRRRSHYTRVRGPIPIAVAPPSALARAEALARLQTASEDLSDAVFTQLLRERLASVG